MNPLPIFFTTYLTLYIIAYFLIFQNWPKNLRPEASSCFISLFHGTPALLLASRAILIDPAHDFDSVNTPSQSLVLDYSIAYFLMDLLHYLAFYPSDYLFIGHHLATLFVFLTCRYVVYHGAYAILVLLILAEVTSFCQNVWTLASARRKDVEFAGKVFGVLSLPFYGFYSVVRGVLGPWFVFRMCVFYGSGEADGVIPRWVWVSWVVVVGMAISASVLWISGLWMEMYRERVKKVEKKAI